MKIKLRYTAQLKDVAKVGTDEMELKENDGIQTLLGELVEKYDKEFGAILFDAKGNYRNSNLIVINQSQVNYAENSLLKDGDKVTIMSPISGG